MSHRPRILVSMTTQPRRLLGTRHAGGPVGGRWASKTVPTVEAADVGFNHDTDRGLNEWDTNTVEDYLGLWTVFTRTVETNSAGDAVVTVATDCDPADMLLLARKGDDNYWSGDNWVNNREDRRIWSADICRRMLEEGLVAPDDDATTYHQPTNKGAYHAMQAASNPVRGGWETSPHVLTGVVAQIRGLRLLQSMMSNPETGFVFGGTGIPVGLDGLLRARFNNVSREYHLLSPPPWDNSAPWGSQQVGGYVTNHGGQDVFVGENRDLIWRALTETDHHGRSPLKAQLIDGDFLYGTAAFVTAAVLYDETAETQLTTGLFEGVEPEEQAQMRTNVLSVFTEELIGPVFEIDDGQCRWDTEQQARIRGFINTVEGLMP